MVGSEEEEPGGGWPYGRIICDLATVPGMTPRALAKKIVQRYVASYPAAENVALSALDLSRLEHLTPAVDRFAAACIGALRNGDEAFFTDALKAVQRFKRRWDFIDVVDFARQVRARSADGGVQQAADALVDVMLDGPKPFVIANGSKGDRVSGAHGAAIYFPAYGDVTVAYPRLDFADATHWDDLIATYRSK
jgi:hypothetical protein